jgi:hypothetical protein
MGAGGTTAKPANPPLIFGFSGALQLKVMGVFMDFRSIAFFHI